MTPNVPMLKQILQDMLDFVAADDPSKVFNMKHWVKQSKSHDWCGTVCCALGIHVIAETKRNGVPPIWFWTRSTALEELDGFPFEEDVATILGITQEQFFFLFLGSRYRRYMDEKIPIERVIKRLSWFISMSESEKLPADLSSHEVD